MFSDKNANVMAAATQRSEGSEQKYSMGKLYMNRCREMEVFKNLDTE